MMHMRQIQQLSDQRVAEARAAGTTIGAGLGSGPVVRAGAGQGSRPVLRFDARRHDGVSADQLGEIERQTRRAKLGWLLIDMGLRLVTAHQTDAQPMTRPS